MKNSTLFLRSVFVIFLIVGSAHFVQYNSQNIILQKEVNLNSKITDKISNNKSKKTKEKKSNYFEGKWKVNYNTAQFNGDLIYKILKQDTIFNAYLTLYKDKNGFSEKADNKKILSIFSFENKSAKGTYIVTYEGKDYTIDCDIIMVDKNTFKLSYNYYGYSDVETWKRI